MARRCIVCDKGTVTGNEATLKTRIGALGSLICRKLAL